MVLVTANEFDNGQPGYDGNLTKLTQSATASDTRVTNFCYDWRDRRTDADGEVDFYEKTYYDNLDRVTKTEWYDTIGPCTPSSSSSSSSSGSALGNLILRSETKFDDRGRVYQTIRAQSKAIKGVRSEWHCRPVSARKADWVKTKLFDKIRFTWDWYGVVVPSLVMNGTPSLVPLLHRDQGGYCDGQLIRSFACRP